MPNNNDEEDLYSDIGDLAKDSNNLMFQLIKDRILKFDVSRTLEINTFFPAHVFIIKDETIFELI